MQCECNCGPTYLVTKVEAVNNVVYMTFRTVPTMVNGEVIKFRITGGLTNVITAGLPVYANVNVNGTLTAVNLLDSIGNDVRSGNYLRTRTTYTAVFGSDPNHLQITKVNGKRCYGV